jgi:hypothetical protein
MKAKIQQNPPETVRQAGLILLFGGEVGRAKAAMTSAIKPVS